MAVIFLNFSVGMLGAGFGGFLVNSIDIAPNHAGVIMVGNSHTKTLHKIVVLKFTSGYWV